MNPKRFLPSDCAAAQKFTTAMVFAALCIVAAFLTGMYTAAANIVGVVFMLFFTAMFGWFAYVDFVSVAQTLQVYYLWRRSNMR